MLMTRANQSVDTITEEHEHEPGCSCSGRRKFLKIASISTCGLILGPELAKAANSRERIVSFYSVNTHERIRTVYWTPEDGYLEEAMKQINWALRDYRRDEATHHDPRLFDLMYAMHLNFGHEKDMHITSGYRSAQTNAMLRKTTSGVARKSMHIEGKAADMRIVGADVTSLRDVAIALRAGGVGYYPSSNFIHMDTGPIRTWS